MFGKHTPSATNATRRASAVAVFTRGIQAGLGTQWRFDFPNGYSASVINDGYGSDAGLFEVAVLRGGRITYETPLTDDVLGWLSDAEVEATLDEIAALPAVTA